MQLFVFESVFYYYYYVNTCTLNVLNNITSATILFLDASV